MNTDNVLVKFDILFGYIVLDSRIRRDGNLIIGEGRAMHYDGNGVLTKDTGWEPTGIVMEVWDEYPYQPRTPWWKFWCF